MSLELLFDIEQNSPEWIEARRGLATTSEFDCIIANGKKKGEPSVGRRRYMLRLAAERLGAEAAEAFSNAHTDRGHLLEDRGRQEYAFITDEEVEKIGFIRDKERMWGASPDGLVAGRRGGLEIKTKLPHLQMEVLIANEMPPDHVAQVQGQMMVGELEFVDFVSFWPGLRPLIKRIRRDEAYIAMLRSEVSRFNDELSAIVDSIRRYGESAAEAA